MKNKLTICWLIVLTVMYFLAWTYTYDTATPASGDDPREADDRMRETKAADRERMDVDHYWPLTGTEVSDSSAGEHRKITYQASIATPTQVSGKAHSYMKSDELYYQDDTNTELQLTDAGTINIVSADLLGTLANNTYFTGVDAAGTGTVDLIKADANDVAVVPDNSQTASNAAPTMSKSLVNKKYVDSYIKLVDSKATTTDGGTFTTGDWRKRTVAEESDIGGHVAVSSSVIVLDAGTYQVSISCPAYKVGLNQARLRNTTGGTTLLVGTAENSTTIDNISTRSVIVGTITVAASQNLEIQHKCSATHSNSGFGLASDQGEAEIYTVAEFWKR